MSNVHTSSVAKEAQGLFAKPSRGFCFPAVQPSLGNLGPVLPCGSVDFLQALFAVHTRTAD